MRGIEAGFIQPGKPDEDACIERFSRTCRAEVLDAHLLETADGGVAITGEWPIDDNQQRPYHSLGRVPPT